jgi:hypothetical protein
MSTLFTKQLKMHNNWKSMHNEALSVSRHNHVSFVNTFIVSILGRTSLVELFFGTHNTTIVFLISKCSSRHGQMSVAVKYFSVQIFYSAKHDLYLRVLISRQSLFLRVAFTGQQYSYHNSILTQELPDTFSSPCSTTGRRDMWLCNNALFSTCFLSESETKRNCLFVTDWISFFR